MLNSKPSILVGDDTKSSLLVELCPTHNYNTQTISIPENPLYSEKEDKLIDEVRLEKSPLKLNFVSYNRNALETGVIVKVNLFSLHRLALSG